MPQQNVYWSNKRHRHGFRIKGALVRREGPKTFVRVPYGPLHFRAVHWPHYFELTLIIIKINGIRSRERRQ